ncbi:MAG: hypothetical protein JNN15_05415 [Blastocatellia bacterium]|nr:hypothetical protein [Blastocatellia bacterium]
MKLQKILVAGSSSNAGKTAMVEILLRQLPGWGGLKVTRVEDRGPICPRGGQGCGVCDSLQKEFEVITQAERLFVEGTDTDRYKKAGAEMVAWVIAQPEALSAAWRATEPYFSGVDGVVIESSSIIAPEESDLSILIINPNGQKRWKSSLFKLLPKVDTVIFNLEKVVESQLESVESIIAECVQIRGRNDLLSFKDLNDSINNISLGAKISTFLAHKDSKKNYF